jgi:hypothetical protein
MMKILATLCVKSVLIICVAGLATACGDDDTSGSDDIDASMTSDDAAVGGYVCDPEGADPEMGELLNAPLEDDVEVIVKTPQHPGDPGPENLP